MPVAVDASKTLLTGIIATTWGNRPSSAGNGQLYLFTDVGASGTIMRYSGSRWRPLAGQAQLASLGAAVTGITNSETIVLQTLIPAGAWQTNDTVRIWFSLTKSGTTDTLIATARVGTAGTTSDSLVWGGITLLAAAGQTGGFMLDVKLASSTSTQVVGTVGGVPAYYGQSTSAAFSPIAISDASANALYISLAVRSNGTTNTVGIQSGQIQLITP